MCVCLYYVLVSYYYVLMPHCHGNHLFKTGYLANDKCAVKSGYPGITNSRTWVIGSITYIHVIYMSYVPISYYSPH